MNKINRILKILEEKYGSNDLTELDYINDYTLLVAVILSAQATDKGVNLATKKLFKIVKTPEEMINLGFEKLNEYIKTINYHNNKAKNIINMSEKLVKNFNSKLPDNMKDLTSLDGVGRKDTHVFRVSNRLGITNATNVKESEKQLMKIVPKKYIRNLNNNLVMFGRYECKALKPQCSSCGLSQYCDYFKDNGAQRQN